MAQSWLTFRRSNDGSSRPTRHVAFAIFATFFNDEKRDDDVFEPGGLVRTPLSRARGSPPSSPSPRSGARAHGARASDARVLGERVRAEGRTRRPAAIDGAHSSRGSAGSHDGRKARPARSLRPASTRGTACRATPSSAWVDPGTRTTATTTRISTTRRRPTTGTFPISRRDLRGTAPGRGADARQRGLRHALQRGGLSKLRNHRLGANCTFVVLPRGASPASRTTCSCTRTNSPSARSAFPRTS